MNRMSRNKNTQQMLAKDYLIPDEIAALVDSSEFLEFVKTLDDTIDDGMTFSELLSSKTILKKALEIIEKYQLDESIEK